MSGLRGVVDVALEITHLTDWVEGVADAEKIVILEGARIPIGSFGGVFKDVPAHELGATASKEALNRARVAPQDIDEVVMGCIGQVGPYAYKTRRVATAAGCPSNVPA